MFHSLKRIATTLALGLALSVSGMAQAQDAEPEVVSLAKVIEDIAASRQATIDRIDTLSAEIDLATVELNEADAAFDEMIATLRAHAAVGDPDGSYVTRLQALEESAKVDAQAAKVEGFLDFEEAFLEDAQVFSDQRGTLVSEFEALERRIRAVEAERKRIVFLIKLRRYDQIQQLFADATGIIQQGADRVAQVEDALRKRDPNLVEN
ncbi:hypothetical protein [Antarctobacter heliothermus]|uniref:Uncharacterized protein n=1 Tax=Antarctobacter heliothermus TaxID=74033 RepID=A0A239EDR1_9RHOB|nr:hypothetical protein [Antarctobacter heliothermus]SNS42133.1 hypothetical protein SAMN04488078_101457 [Antarctobacter heliothermus]